MERLNQVDTKNAISRQVFTIDGRKFSNMKGFYQEVEAVFTDGLDWHIGDNLDAFNDVLRGVLAAMNMVCLSIFGGSLMIKVLEI